MSPSQLAAQIKQNRNFIRRQICRLIVTAATTLVLGAACLAGAIYASLTVPVLAPINIYWFTFMRLSALAAVMKDCCVIFRSIGSLKKEIKSLIAAQQVFVPDAS